MSSITLYERVAAMQHGPQPERLAAALAADMLGREGFRRLLESLTGEEQREVLNSWTLLIERTLNHDH